MEAQNVRIRMDDFTNDFIVESPDLPLESRYRAYGAKYGAYRVRPRASVQPPAREHGCRYLGLEESSDWEALQPRGSDHFRRTCTS